MFSAVAVLVAGITSLQIHAGEAQQSIPTRENLDVALAVTAHPPLPSEPSHYWFVPDASAGVQAARRTPDPGIDRLVRGAKLIADGDFAAGLPLVSVAQLSTSPLADYAKYYTGVAQLGLARYDDALTTFSQLVARPLQGALKELVVLRLADVALVVDDPDRVEDALAALSAEKLANPEDVWLQRARVEEAAGHREHALEAYRRLHYQYPLSTQSGAAPSGIARLETQGTRLPDAFERDLARAEQFFKARRWSDARSEFASLRLEATGDAKELVALRIAECDYYLSNRRQVRDALRPLLNSRVHGAEARHFYLTTARALGDRATFLKMARELVDEHPRSVWSEETLDDLATYHITNDDDSEADVVLRELLRLFPKGRYAERAAWKVGWWAYRAQRFAETIEIFDTAASTFPRADNRPAWIYWSGRARDRIGERSVANARYRLVVADYKNSYYGRLASALLADRREAPLPVKVGTMLSGTSISAAIPTTDLIRELSSAQMYDEALKEVQYAQRVWGDTPQLQATSAWIRHRQGFGLTAQERFNAVRGAITTMRRAYPQFMASGGESLPADVLRVIFPLDYWNLITKYSEAHKLDPYLMAALMAQESTFTPEIRSSANAYGLMQIIPSTGRVYARKLGIRPFSTASLKQPETNVRIGTQYFRDLIDRFGGAHFALASYNAGEHRVARWNAEKPGIPQDEFIDDIPFPETQNYVKRILGTAEDYRRLYGGGLLNPNLRPDRTE